jgi:hypothetical protein
MTMFQYLISLNALMMKGYMSQQKQVSGTKAGQARDIHNH